MKLDVLKILIEKKENININQLAKLAMVDYKNAYMIVKKLEKEGIVRLERFGKTINCILNKKVHSLIFQAEFERREELIKNKNIDVLYKKLNSLPFSFISLIFGSCLKGKIKKGSDIDLMAICEKNREKEIENTVSLLPLDIHLIVLSYEEFLSMAKSREFSVVSEAMKNNVLLVGIEDYYRLVKND